MAEEVKIDKQVFQDRLGQLISAWKAEKRSGDALFGGVGSIVVVLGKADDAEFQKNNALHVSFVPELTYCRGFKRLTRLLLQSSGY